MRHRVWKSQSYDATRELRAPRTGPWDFSCTSQNYLNICMGFLPSAPMTYQAVAPMC